MKCASVNIRNFSNSTLRFLARNSFLTDNDTMKTVLIVAAAIVVLVGGAYAYTHFTKEPSYDVVSVTRGPIIQEVLASGSVRTPNTINLHFKERGRLVRLPVAVGQSVHAGDIVATQDTTQLDAQVKEVQVSIEIEKTKLAQLLAGSSPEIIAAAQANLNTARDELRNAIRDAYTKADDAVRNRADQLFKNPETSSASFGVSFTSGGTRYAITTSNNELRFKINSGRVAVEKVLDGWNNPERPSGDDAKKVEQDLGIIEDMLYNISLAINNLSAKDTDANTVYENFKSNISTARTNVSAVRSSVVTARAGLLEAEQVLEQERAPIRTTDIALHQAQIRQAEATLARVEALIGDTVLTAPTSGIVTATNGEIGEIVGAETAVVSIMTGTPEIQADLSETNVAHVMVGQSVRITLDSFPGSLSWKGKVAEIDPAGTSIGGNVYYKTKIVFTEPDEQVKVGMTANVYIEIASREDALLVPISAVKTESGTRVVEVVRDGVAVSVPVTVGIESKGMVEIISGLTPGEQVALSLK